MFGNASHSSPLSHQNPTHQPYIFCGWVGEPPDHTHIILIMTVYQHPCTPQEKCIHSKQLEEIGPEKFLVEKSEPVLGDVDPSIIQGMVSARKAFNAFLNDGDVDSSSAMTQLIKIKESFLLALDKTFDHEMHFLVQQMGPQGEQRVLKHVLNLMPKASPVLTQPTHQKVLEGISSLQASKLLQMQSKGVQGQLQAVKDMIQKMVMGKPPGITKHSSQFAMQVANMLPNFFSVDKLNDDGVTTTRLLGKPALQHSFKEWEAMHHQI